MKIIKICGSYKYINEMKEAALDLELNGIVALTPIDLTKPKEYYSDDDFNKLGLMHKEKIRISDGILVVNVDNYIGESTRSEIEFAKSLNKEVLYWSDFNEKKN
ncbi:MAG: hypothetical protein Q4E69_04730 [Bacilli bacterium]|nr:hypothetical protein [Bacilli bacterium]